MTPDTTDGTVLIFKGDDGSRMVAIAEDDAVSFWELLEHSVEPTIRVVMPDAGDLSDGCPEPIGAEVSARTELIEVLTPEAKLSILELLARRAYDRDPGIRVDVWGMPGVGRDPGAIGVIVIYVRPWVRFLALLDLWRRNDFADLAGGVSPHVWGAARWMLHCLAITAREWRGTACHGSMMLRIEIG